MRIIHNIPLRYPKYLRYLRYLKGIYLLRTKTIRRESKQQRAEAIEANTPLLGVRVGSKVQNSGFTLRKFPTPIRIIIYDWRGNVVSDTTQNGDGADKMDTPLYNVKYYSHNPSATNSIVSFEEDQREVTESTAFVHIRKKPPIIQTIVLRSL